MLNRDDIDAVIVATPDHWHATIALEAMDRGKDVYSKSRCATPSMRPGSLVDTVKETKRVLQVGSQTTSGDQWSKAQKAIADGMIGPDADEPGLIPPQLEGRRMELAHRRRGGPDGKGENYIDWKMWLGPAQKRGWDADRFFRFRKYWDYSGGIATDLFYHVVAPMNICWGEPQFPYKVQADGGIFVFKNRPENPSCRIAKCPIPSHLIGNLREGPSARAEFLDGELASTSPA